MQNVLTKSPRHTAFDDVAETFSRSRELSLRVLTLADKLCGMGAGTDSAGGKVAPMPDGVLAAMADDADRARGLIDSASAALDRIEVALP